MTTCFIRQCGAVIIGDEILSGRRDDAHLPFLIQTLAQKGVSLGRVTYVGDDATELLQTLQQSRMWQYPVFCFGGIGATEDDRTRQMAAQLFEQPLCRHPEAEKMIRERFGDAAEPNRILMADLPQGAHLIPNPMSQIPGFQVDQHFFLPGFPQMAHPMVQWCLTHRLTVPGHPTGATFALWVRTPESDLVPIMRELSRTYPHCRFFSLPHVDPEAPKELGFRSKVEEPTVQHALIKALQQASIPWSTTPDSLGK
ncbi:competence/damage-inducible protein A [Magnetococcus sp. PR-3]|uniref:competence/damage-inducible protein A n=1 Tax=Magnetococcus sp. PR-3 TaxID=3120355 RepID=UPI002FCE5403